MSVIYRSYFTLLCFVIAALVQLANTSHCQAQSTAFTYEGRLFSSAGTPVLEPVDIKFQILNPAGTCVLYEEIQTGIDLATSRGAFSLSVGSASGDSKRSTDFRGAFNPSMISVFRNGTTLAGIPAASCPGGAYTSASSDSRKLRVEIKKGSVTEILSPDLVINSNPFAQVAQTLQGFFPSDFLRLDLTNGISGHLALTPVGTAGGQTREFRFYELAGSGAEYLAFKAPDAVSTSLTYVLPSAQPAAGDILKATVPTAGVVTLSWGADAGAGGGISSLNGSNQSLQTFPAIDIAAAITAPAWSTNAGTGTHTLQIPLASGAGVTGGLITKTEHTSFSGKVNRAGDTMSGVLAMGTNKITGVVDPTSAQEAATKAYVDAQTSGKISGNLTATRVPFATGASTLSDDTNLIWDNTNKRLGVGTGTPGFTIDTTASGIIRANTFHINDNTSTVTLGVSTKLNWTRLSLGFGGPFFIARENVLDGHFNIDHGAGKWVTFGDLDYTTTPGNGKIAAPAGQGTNIPGGSLTLRGGLATGDATTGDIIFEGAAVGGSGTSLQTANPYLTIKGGGATAGYVGVGITNPAYPLDVSGAVRAGTTLVSGLPPKVQSTMAMGVDGVIVGRIQLGNSVNGIRIYDNFDSLTAQISVNGITSFSSTPGMERLRIDSTGNVGVGSTTPATKLHVAGEIKVGNTAVACSATIEGAMRYDSGDKEMEFCNGTAWIPVAYAYSQPLLTITPSTSTMNVTGPGTPAYSGYVTFTVENIGNVDSNAITFTLTDTNYFEFGANTCVGGASVLSLNETCTIQVRAKAAIDTTYGGQLRVNTNNQPTVVLNGTSTGTCGAAGDNYGGGKLVKCEATYALVATPGGCTNSSTPTCAGTVDTTMKTFSSDTTNYRGALSNFDGLANTGLLVANIANPPTYNAAAYCDDMTYGGFSDWYLPAVSELTAILNVRAAIGGFPTGGIVVYWSSTEQGPGQAANAWQNYVNIDTSTVFSFSSQGKTQNQPVRCVRRQF